MIREEFAIQRLIQLLTLSLTTGPETPWTSCGSPTSLPDLRLNRNHSSINRDLPPVTRFPPWYSTSRISWQFTGEYRFPRTGTRSVSAAHRLNAGCGNRRPKTKPKRVISMPPRRSSLAGEHSGSCRTRRPTGTMRKYRRSQFAGAGSSNQRRRTVSWPWRCLSIAWKAKTRRYHVRPERAGLRGRWLIGIIPDPRSKPESFARVSCRPHPDAPRGKQF